MTRDMIEPQADRFLVRVLGPFSVSPAVELGHAPTRQVARVGALLTAQCNDFVERRHLIRAIWGDDPPATVDNTLQVHVSGLRRLVGRDRVEYVDGRYRLIAEPHEVDVLMFEQSVAEGGERLMVGDAQTAFDMLGVALSLWRGQPFAEVRDQDIDGRRARLKELREQAVEYRLDAALGLARTRLALDSVIAAAREQVARQPQRSAAHAVLVQALERAGRFGELAEAKAAAAQSTSWAGE